MRAYLGNVLVTPKAKWLEKESPIFYPINSEFVQIIPNDKLPYFWWSYLKSALFLHQMPTGSGGTRPRVSIENLKQIPVVVPMLEERTKINNCLIELAEQSWRNYILCRNIIKKITYAQIDLIIIMSEISQQEIKVLRNIFAPLIGIKIDWLSIPHQALPGFEPSQIALIVNTLLDSILPQIELISSNMDIKI
jgi:hypothetical protein